MDDLIQTFLEETDDNLRLLEEGLFALKSDPDNAEHINEVFRAMHTIKGGAGLMGFDRINRVGHHLEDILDRVRQGKMGFSDDVFQLMLAGADLFRSIMESGDLEAASFQTRCDEVIANSEKVLNGGTKKKKSKKDQDAGAQAPVAAEPQPVQLTNQGAPSRWDDPDQFPFIKADLRFQTNVFETGTDPLMLIMELEGHGETRLIRVNTEQLPPLTILDPEQLYLSWEIWLDSRASKSDLDTVFLFVKEDHPIQYDRCHSIEGPCEVALPVPDVPANTEQPQADVQHHQQVHQQMPETTVVPSKSSDFTIPGVELWDEPVAVTAESVKYQTTPAYAAVTQSESEQTSGLVPRIQAGETADNRKTLTTSETIRVDTSKLEQMLNYVAEVVIAQSRVKELVFRLTGDRRQNTELSNAFQEVDKIIRYLQEEVMKTTMIPIAGLFSRFQRMIRDLEKEIGKRVDVILEGKDTEVDKNVIEQMTDPLKHIIRNAVDHGMETPEERVAIGKPPVGKVVLRAYHQEGSIFIEIEDDGRGINQKAVVNKAVEKGLISPLQKLTDQEIYRLLFRPGFSTAKQVTDLSGRGVGLDVVLTNIQKMRGEVEVFSELGKGTMFQIKLPLTLAIIDGMMIQVGDERLILPLTNVVELIRPVPQMIKSVENRGMIVHVRDEYVPYVHLADVFRIYGGRHGLADGILIILREGQKKMALHVDHIIGQEQVVIRSIKENAGVIDGIAGATIMGDGQVVTILDVSFLFRSLKNTGFSMVSI